MMRTVPLILLAAGLLAPIPARSAAAQLAQETFRPGDVVRLEVEGDTLLTGTYTVGPGPALVLPAIGEISLAGVTRARVEPHLQAELSRYLKRAVIRAKALIRLSIVGEVTRPGIYPVATDLVVADALMLAGGPTPSANFGDTEILRGSSRLVDAGALQQAFGRGLTVDELNLRAGDQIFVPRAMVRDPESTWRIVGIILTIPVAIFTITRLGK